MTLLCLLNPFVRRRRREVIIIYNNNKAHSSELSSTRVNEVLIIKHMLRNVRWVNDNAFAIFELSHCFIIGLYCKSYATLVRYQHCAVEPITLFDY